MRHLPGPVLLFVINRESGSVTRSRVYFRYPGLATRPYRNPTPALVAAALPVSAGEALARGWLPAARRWRRA